MPQLTRLAAFAKKNAGRLATGAVVCLCAAALLLPGVLGAARQAQLLGQVQPRPAVAGVPSEQARSIPLLYDLYRRQAGDPLPQADTAAEAGEAAAVAADLAGRLRALAGAGLLTDAQRDAVLRLLAEPLLRGVRRFAADGDGGADRRRRAARQRRYRPDTKMTTRRGMVRASKEPPAPCRRPPKKRCA